MVESDDGSIARKIEEAGVVGGGGAGFPTHVKARAEADVVIANGAECEPLLSCDKELMIRDPDKVVEGLMVLGRATGATRLILAVKDKNKTAIQALEKASAGKAGVELLSMGNFYPAGDEVTLVYEATGRIVPEGGIPPDVGVVVQNVGTLVMIADAMAGKPVTRRFVTVAGEVKNPVTLDVPIGASLQSLIHAAGGPLTEPFSVVLGGPCMGQAAASLDEPVLKTLTGVLLLAPDHKLVQYKIGNLDQLLHRAKSVCDQCRDCTDLCPRFLLGHKMEPHLLMTAIGWGNELGRAELETAHLCCECGICGIYACPMDLHPNLYIRRIKEELKAAGIPRTKGSAPDQPLESYSMRKLPYARLKTRLGLGKYTDHAPLAAEPLQVDEVKLLLHQHVGAPCEAVVKPGQEVKEGDPVGEVPPGALGARVHASISGKVKEVNEQWVIIQSR